MQIFIYVVIAALIGAYLGKRRKMGVWVGALICVATSPIIGAVIISFFPLKDQYKKEGKNYW